MTKKRPSKDTPLKHRAAIRLDDALDARITKQAEKEQRTKKAIVSLAVEAYLKSAGVRS